MKAAKRPVAGAAVMSVALAAAMVMGVGLGSCQSLGLGSGARKGELAKRGGAEETAGVEIHRVAGLTGEPEVRVRIATAVPEGKFEGPEGFRVGPAGNRGAQEVLRSPVVVTLREDVWAARDGRGVERTWGRDRDLEVSPATSKVGEAGWTALNGLKYAGTFRLSGGTAAAMGRLDAATAAAVGGSVPPAAAGSGAADGAGAATAPVFDIIEHVMLEEYVPGVVALELPNSWSVGAFKVQAVAARTYAVHQRQRSLAAGRKFDLESTTQDQVYKGAVTLPTAREAVRQTRGQVLEFGGAVLRAYYSSTCGGRTGSARDTWPTSRGFEFNLAAPLQAAERPFACEGSPLFRWRVERPKADLVTRLRAYGERNGFLVRNIKDLAKIEVHKTNEVGRPSEYKIIEPGGRWFSLKAEDLRVACNADLPGAIPVTRQTRVNSSDMEVVVQGSTVTISGRGFGHGVGMCQYCAEAMSRRGEDSTAMLERFYPGASVVRAY